MNYVLCGSNDYLINQKLHSILDEQKKLHPQLDIEKIYCDESDLVTLKNICMSGNLFTTDRVIIIYSPLSLKGFNDEFEELIKISDDETTLIFIEKKLDKKSKFYSFAKKQDNFFELNKLSRPELISWIASYISKEGGLVDNSSAAYLVDRVGDDQYNLSNDASKLILFNKRVNKESIDLLTQASVSSTIFDLLNYAFNLDTVRALKIYLEQRYLKVEPDQILSMLSWQLSNLALVRYSEGDSGLSSFQVNKARRLLNKVGEDKIKSLISKLSNIDYKSKTSPISLDEALMNYLVTIS